MFSKLFALVALNVAVTNGALIHRQDDTPVTIPSTSCEFLPIDCCSTITRANNPTTSVVLATLGIAVKDPTLYAGIGCEPVQGTIGPGGNATCLNENFHPLCCGTKTSFKIDADCTFVDINA
ncbi:hypothetical protein BXZ70DRAFT_1077773 [Cristinia sonorae]|uniref:Hydrophobin n=1 Tax=Cristinia sonorae TaxID=1940300 RepID=A0A8K0XPR1_9AGAR|nr:hypothetical protein BXZ70DRAFT_1077773 [Cristinia sonorae]